MPQNDPDITELEKLFNNAVREYIISFLLFVVLYVCSYATVCYFKKRPDADETYAGEDDAMVYRISLWLCTFTIAISVGVALLLPLSILSNEVLLLYPDSYWVKWLNSSLIHSLWNKIFLSSNLALFVMLPFAYFFTESEGFSGSKKGIMARVYETAVVLMLLAILVCGLAWVVSLIMDDSHSSRQALFDVWNFYLPYLFSLISLFGVCLLLLCTPVGFATMFTVIGQLVIKPTFLQDIEDELHSLRLEEESRRIKLTNTSLSNGKHKTKTKDHSPNGQTLLHNGHNGHSLNGHATNGHIDPTVQIAEIRSQRLSLEKRAKASSLRRNLCYPLVMLGLLALTAISVLMIAHNTFELLAGIKSLPVGAKEAVLGITSLSIMGSFGAAMEIGLIIYLLSCSVVGFYSLPFFCRLQPVKNDTPLIKLIGNCGVILIMSSALPVMSRTLGLTNFDLLGNFGRIDWLGNFYLVFIYNVAFGTTLALCLCHKFTAPIRRELYERFYSLFQREKTD